MRRNHDRNRIIRDVIIAGLLSSLWSTHVAIAGAHTPGAPSPAAPGITAAIGRPTDHSVAINVVSVVDAEIRIAFSPDIGGAPSELRTLQLTAGAPGVVEIEGLRPDTRYRYVLQHRQAPGDRYAAEPVAYFQTARRAGSAFVFTVQGDSHPERVGRMFEASLYRRTLQAAAAASPDFHVLLGDDFSIERLISSGRITQAGVDAVYATQRNFLDVISRSTAMVLVNGNHEEAGRFLLDGTPRSPAVLAGRARNAFFALPAPDGFYSGDAEEIEHVGLPRDYYAWTWGDALFVVLDPYWHSTLPDTTTTRASDAQRGGGSRRQAARGAGGGAGGNARGDARGNARGNAQQAAGLQRDSWNLTLGDAQYAWLAKTLRGSTARWKFVFAHHVLGGGRGGVELADSYEWGGRDRDGVDRFHERRPRWEMPIHQLFVQTGVTAFFQGHDHLYARQEKDGVVYQSVPNPADPTFTAFNREAYRSGDVFPNSGHLRVSVTPDSVRVAYLRTTPTSSPAASADAGATTSPTTLAHQYLLLPTVRR